MSSLSDINCCWADPAFLNQTNVPSGVPGVDCNGQDITLPKCESIVLNYCVNEPNTVDEFKKRWSAGNIFNINKETSGNSQIFSRTCYYPLARYLSAGSVGDFPIQSLVEAYQSNISGNVLLSPTIIKGTDPTSTDNALDKANKLISEMLIKYQSTLKYNVLLQPGSSGAEPVTSDGLAFSTQLFNICKSVPFLCENTQTNKQFLSNLCKGVTANQMLSDNNLLRQWCGCYLSPDVYRDQYLDITIPCTPYCNSDTVIGLTDGTSTSTQQCSQNTCIIDDITINLIEDRGGSISLGNLCSNCSKKDETCSCEIGGNTITFINDKLNNVSGGNLNITTVCKDISNCYRTKDGARVKVPCDDDENKTTDQLIEQQYTTELVKSSVFNFAIPFIIIAVVILVVVVFLLFDNFLKLSKK